MQSAVVVLLDFPDGGNESIHFNEMAVAALGGAVEATGNSTYIRFDGSASAAVYEQLLAGVSYFNSADEPTRVPARRIAFEVFDGVFSSDVVTGLVNVTLVNDNPLVLSCGAGIVNFIEETLEPVSLTEMLRLSDSDTDHVITSAEVAITNPLNPQNGDVLSISNDTLPSGVVIEQPSGSTLSISGLASAVEYQELLQTLTYSTTAEEPSPTERVISVSVASRSEQRSCTVMLRVMLVNDNPPVVDLNGPEASVDNNVEVDFSFFETASVPIAEFAEISDADSDGTVVSLTLQLMPGRPGDRLRLDDCLDSSAPSCHLQLPQRVCVCADGLQVSQDPNTLSINRTQYSIEVVQSESSVLPPVVFTQVLRSVRFEHDPTRPEDSIYTAMVTVTASDGELESDPAVSVISVILTNAVPTILFNGAMELTNEIRDGVTTLPLLPTGTTLTIQEDGTMLESVTLTLTNPRIGSERLEVSELSTSIESSYVGPSLLLMGPANISEFTAVLREVRYVYPPMESILMGEAPDFTLR